MSEDDLKDILKNWGRWARDKRHLNHCASLEHRYRSPQTWWPEDPKTECDILQAIAVQKVIARLGHDPAWALTFAYCYPGFDRWKAARHCGVYRPERLERLTRRAEFMVRNNLKIKTTILNESDIKQSEDIERTGVILIAA